MGVHSIPLNQSHERHAMTGPQPTWPTTTNAGIPVESDEHSLTIGPDGPILPERQPHAKASGASR
jgi:catalase